jgi:DNA-binding NarL/FixJ family response regulator
MPSIDLNKCSFLVVDDDDLARDVIGNTLNFIGATQVFFAEDGASAYRLAQANQPDFVLLDLYMPELDVWDLLKKLRQVLPRAAMLMVTGSHRNADFIESLHQQVDGFCIKPVMPDVMEKALIGARQRRQMSQR